MPTNPYTPPEVEPEPPRRRSRVWTWIGVAGLALMLVSGAALCGTADFQRGGVTYRSAHLALLLMAAFGLGFLGLIVGSAGVLVGYFRRR